MPQSQPSRRDPSGAATAVRRRAWLRPVMQFIAAGLIAVIVLIAATIWFSKRAATDEAIADARSITEILGRSVAEPEIPPGLVDLRVSAQDKFDQIARRRLLVGNVLRVKIWNANGTILYSDKTQLIGETFQLGEEERNVVTRGGSDAEVSDLTAPENRYERNFGRLLEVYTRIWAPTGQPLLFEAYYSYDVVLERSSDILASFRPITIAALLIFVGLTMPLVWVLARRLDRAAGERERLLVAAVEASAQERRRIARDLHDGVVQDLAGLSFAASASAREAEGRPEFAERLEAIGQGVRHSMRALRSLLVEIYPPELQTEGLAAALDDLVAPATAAGVTVELDVQDTDGARDEAIAIVWRTAQESVRNAIRHGHPQRLSVSVSGVDDRLRLVVADDGSGFDPSVAPRDGHLGLRGLRDLIHEMGGTLVIESEPGAGTQVTMEVGR